VSHIGIKLQRLARGLSQHALAERAGVVQSTVSRAERGLSVQGGELERIVRALAELGHAQANDAEPVPHTAAPSSSAAAPCGHRHRTLLAAERCARGLDHRGHMGARAQREWTGCAAEPPASWRPCTSPDDGAEPE
jgi:transcriptional regulator with XRE-family HTH domain